MKCQNISLTCSIFYILLLAVNFFYVYKYILMLTVKFWLLLVCNWLGLLSSKQEQFWTISRTWHLGQKIVETLQICAWPGLHIVRATSLEALQISYTEFLAISIAVIHWGATAKEPLSAPGVFSWDQSCESMKEERGDSVGDLSSASEAL